MKTQNSDLKTLGWNDWFEQRAECGPAATAARVAAVDRDQWLLVDGAGHFRAKLGGSYPQIGDRPRFADIEGGQARVFPEE